MVATITALFNLYKNTRSQLDHVMASIAQRERQADDDSVRFDYSPYDEVTDFLEQHANWFELLEERAQQFRRDCALGRRVTSDDLERGLLEQVGVRVHRIPERADSSVIRMWNADERVLTVSEDLFEQRLKFQLAHTIALGLFDEEKLHKADPRGVQWPAFRDPEADQDPPRQLFRWRAPSFRIRSSIGR